MLEKIQQTDWFIEIDADFMNDFGVIYARCSDVESANVPKKVAVVPFVNNLLLHNQL